MLFALLSCLTVRHNSAQIGLALTVRSFLYTLGSGVRLCLQDMILQSQVSPTTVVCFVGVVGNDTHLYLCLRSRRRTDAETSDTRENLSFGGTTDAGVPDWCFRSSPWAFNTLDYPSFLIKSKMSAITDCSEEQRDDKTGPASPKRRRRSLRDTQRLRLPPKTSLAYRRLDQLFFQTSDDDDDNDNDDSEASNEKGPLIINHLTLKRVSVSPHIYVLDSFLKAAELTHFQAHIRKGRFQRSYVDQIDTSTPLFDTQHRTSTFLSFEKQHDAKIAAVEQRAADLLGGAVIMTVEALQLVRYLPGQFFGVHHDLGDYHPDDGTVALPPKSCLVKRRLVTIFCYLNDCSNGGGATHFPRAGNLRVTPMAGRAVLFANVQSTGRPDPRTIHAGEPVQSNVKYGLNIWLCEE